MVNIDHIFPKPHGAVPASLEASRNRRAELAAQFIPSGSHVLDLHFGDMSLQQFLPHGCNYRGCDLAAREAPTIGCEVSTGQFPTGATTDADIIVALGLLENLQDTENFLAQLRASKRDVVLSYCATDLSGSVDRKSLGCLTDFSFLDLAELFDR